MDRSGEYRTYSITHTLKTYTFISYSPEDAKVPPSLPYHLADIYLEELDKASSSSQDSSPPPAPLTSILDPFFSLAARTPAKMTVQRIESALLEPLFNALDSALSSAASENKSDEEDEDEDEDNSRSRKRPRLSKSPEFPNIIAHSCVVGEKGDDASGAADLRKGLLKRLFEVASEESTRDANRRKIYKFWKARADDGEESD